MKQSLTLLSLIFTSEVNAFSVLPRTEVASRITMKSRHLGATPYFLDEVETISTRAEATVTKKNEKAAKTEGNKQRPKTVQVKKPNHKEGVFSPIVFASKKVLGDETINQIRAKFISLHSNVIGDFVETHYSPMGTEIAKNLFVVMDANSDGTLDKEELKAAFETLGFTWLKDKQIEGILQRADLDSNGVIDYDEFKAELSKTLRTNLIKLAKKNGEAMGLLV